MEMINKTAYRDLQEVGMEDTQAQAVASHIPDWSQFATKQDMSRLRQDMSDLESRLRQDMSGLESRLIRWMVGIFLTFLALLGGLVTLSLNIYGLLG